MAKKIRRMLAMFMVLCVFMSAAPLQALAAEAETNTQTTTETTTEGELRTETTTTTTTTTDEEGNVTVVITIEKTTEGTDENGADVEGSEIYTEENYTSADGTYTSSQWEEEGSEKLEWTEEVPETQTGMPEVEVELKPGETTTATESDSTTVTEGDVPEDEDDEEYDYTKTTTTTDREVTVESSEVEISVGSDGATELESVQTSGEVGEGSVNHIRDTNSTINPEYWAIDYGFFDTKVPDGWTMEKLDEDSVNLTYITEEGATCTWTVDWSMGNVAVVTFSGDEKAVEFINDKFLYTGNGHYTPNKDGFMVIKEGATAKSEKVNAQIFALRDGEGNYHYAYCVDMDTSAVPYTWYTVDNLEDSTYYATEDAEEHIRFIAKNGYWGTADNEDDTAAIGSVKNIIETISTDPNVDLNEKITVGNEEITVGELIKGLKESEALNATQAAIWTYSNGSTREGEDKGGIVVGEFFNRISGVSEQDKKLSVARMEFLYNYLKNGTDDNEGTEVIDKDRNFTDMSITVGDKVGEVEVEDAEGNTVTNGVYETALNFTLAFVPGKNDDLLVHVSYIDLDGVQQTVVRRLAGENTEGRSFESITADENGSYTIKNLKLSENQDFNFDLKLEGTQYLEQGVYIYSPVDGARETSQTFVSLAEGNRSVDVTASVTVSFTVDETNHVVAEREWHVKGDSIINETDPPVEEEEIPEKEIPDEEVPADDYGFRLARDGEELEEIPDEEVPLAEAPKTGDVSPLLIAMIVIACFGLVALNLSDKKRNHTTF